ncbi:MAG: hypothetical protein ACPG7F_00375 [Aggregatilineales bacterium]
MEFHHDPTLTWKAFLIGQATGKIPPIHEVAGDGYPMTYIRDIITWQAQAAFQWSHEVAEQEARAEAEKTG